MWKFRTGGPVFSSPAVSGDGSVFVGSDDAHLYALNRSGGERWNFQTGRAVKSSPSIGADGTVYFGSMDHRFYGVH
jgi:outer membrane protein assembly factor BamB